MRGHTLRVARGGRAIFHVAGAFGSDIARLARAGGRLAGPGHLLLNEPMERSDVSEQPLVSVIVASFNYERYIRRTLQSILDQTIANFEIVVVDDGSTDGSLEIVRSFDDARIRLFVNERNIGLVPTYNAACGSRAANSSPTATRTTGSSRASSRSRLRIFARIPKSTSSRPT